LLFVDAPGPGSVTIISFAAYRQMGWFVIPGLTLDPHAMKKKYMLILTTQFETRGARVKLEFFDIKEFLRQDYGKVIIS